MEIQAPPLCDIDVWLMGLASGISALIAGSVYLLLG